MLKRNQKKARTSASVKAIDYKVQPVPISELRINPNNVRNLLKKTSSPDCQLYRSFWLFGTGVNR